MQDEYFSPTRLVSLVAIAAYLSRPRYLRAVCFLSLYLTANHGISPHSACTSIYDVF